MSILACATVAHGQATRPATAPATAPAFEAHEWAVFVFDRLSDKLNPDGIVTSDLPSFVSTRRTADDPSPAGAISPVGVIRFTGHPDGAVDVNLSRGGGTIMASWPHAQERGSGDLWRSLAVRDTPAGDAPAGVAADAPFARLRRTASPFVLDAKGTCEPFLLYDVQVPYKCPLEVATSTPAGVRVSNGGQAPLHDVVLFRRAAGGWASATVDLLGPGASAPPQPAQTTGRATTGPATTRPTTGPATTATSATQPTVAAVLLLAGAAAASPEQLAAAYVHRAMPDLSSDDAAVVVGLVVRYGFDGGRLTAAYHLDGGDMDRLLPLEVLPQPTRTVRNGLVLVRNPDPAAGTDVDDLIGQLGDNAWAKREAASKALLAVGPAAADKLRAAANSHDPEVVWRAERILAASKTP